MEQLSETARVDRELEQAQRDLQETLEQVNQKIKQVETRLQPQAIMRANPVALPFLAGLLGFFAGSKRPFRWVAIGLMMAAVAAAHRGSNNGSDRTNESSL
jgi:Flp pilus assembly protein TadB